MNWSALGLDPANIVKNKQKQYSAAFTITNPLITEVIDIMISETISLCRLTAMIKHYTKSNLLIYLWFEKWKCLATSFWPCKTRGLPSTWWLVLLLFKDSQEGQEPRRAKLAVGDWEPNVAGIISPYSISDYPCCLPSSNLFEKRQICLLQRVFDIKLRVTWNQEDCSSPTEIDLTLSLQLSFNVLTLT